MDRFWEELQLEHVAAEMAVAPLGDERLCDRLEESIAALMQNPEASFAELCDAAGCKGLYRLLRNPRSAHRTLAEPHLQATADRVERCPQAFLISDTTDVRVKHLKGPIEGMGQLNNARDRGFRWHSVIAVSADTPHLPLGTLDYVVLTRKPTAVAAGHPRVEWDHLDNEGQRWQLAIERALSRLECRDEHRHIHLADRESDDYALMSWLCQQHERFVIRANHDREVVDESSPNAVCSLQQALQRLEPVLGRSIEVSTRDNSAAAPSTRRQHPSREARTARVEVRGGQFTVLRPESHASKGKCSQPWLVLSVVEVYEVDVPRGVEPVHWVLLSTEPVETPEQIEWIVDAYRVRWVYEEQTKAHKSGCSLHKHCFRSAWTWCAYLALTLPLAWRLLALRCARESDDIDARVVLRASQMAVLERHGRSAAVLERHGRTLRAVTYAIAALGGHRSSSGPPGWLVLARGYARLLQLEAGFLLASQPVDSTVNPRAPPHA